MSEEPEPTVIEPQSEEIKHSKKRFPKLKKKPNKSKVLKTSMFVALVVLSGISVYFYSQYRQVKNNPKEVVAQQNKQETQEVLGAVKSAIIIEESEQPTVARVDDPEKLKKTNAEFYKNVQKGDYLIIYPKRAIIYRQSNDQIVNVAPIINTADLKKTSQEGTTNQ